MTDELKATENPGPGMAHYFYCTHDPCVCEQDTPAPADLLYEAWGVIANARDWLLTDDQSQEWVDAAERWRDKFHDTLSTPYARQKDVEQFYTFILEALGAASVCWDKDGVFMQNMATQTARTLIDRLCDEGYVDKSLQIAPPGYTV